MIDRIVICVLAVLPVMAQNGPAIDPQSLEKEAALGKQLAAEMTRSTTLVPLPAVQDYADRLTQRLARFSSAKVPYTTRVVAEDPCSELHEPVALPGGYLFLPVTLFLAAQDEAEFAGMLAHAMSHIATRHGIRTATSNRPVGSANIPIVFLGDWSGSCSNGLAIPASYVQSQRGFEQAADALALDMMARAGFDPHALLHYIERIRPGDPRIAAMASTIGAPAATNPPVSGSGEFGAARDAVRGLSPRRPKVAPSLRR